MNDMTILSRCALTLVIYLFICDTSDSFSIFNCQKPKDADPGSVPTLPKSFSASMRIHFLNKKYMVEMTYARNLDEGKELIEFKRKGRRVKYITTDKNTLLFIQYSEDAHPTCEVTNPGKGKSFLKEEDTGEQDIVLKALEPMMFPNAFDLYSVSPETETGVFANRFQGCLTEPKINISISFAEEGWEMPYTSPLLKNVRYPETATAEFNDVVITVLYNSFDPNTPDDTVFQPPFDVYCDGFRSDRKLPEITDYFMYDSEIIVYESAMGIAPIVSHRRVLYDYFDRIARVDFDDAYSDNPDMFDDFIAEQKTIIYDFKAGAHYIIDPYTGKCKRDTFKSTFDFLSFEASDTEKQLKANEYFWLNGGKTSYNGQFPVRGMMADVYTGIREDPKTKKPCVISWYFSTKETRVVGTDNIEKNSLLRIYVRPKTDLEKEGVTEINFFGFSREEPSIFEFDITNCFNDSTSKILVLTFPADESLRGLEKLIGLLTLYSIEAATGLQAHRINMMKVLFTSEYIYAEFSLLEDFSADGKNSGNETSVDEALKKLREAVDSKNFVVPVASGTKIFTLEPVPNGLNVFAGDHVRTAQGGYKKGEVIGLTVGMLLLGFLLGFVALNMIMSRKYGVSLFKKSKYGNDPFSNFNGDSSM